MEDSNEHSRASIPFRVGGFQEADLEWKWKGHYIV